MKRCPHCHQEDCPGRLGSLHYSNEDFDACQEYHRQAVATYEEPIDEWFPCPGN